MDDKRRLEDKARREKKRARRINRHFPDPDGTTSNLIYSFECMRDQSLELRLSGIA
jgi:hypothetical protein